MRHVSGATRTRAYLDAISQTWRSYVWHKVPIHMGKTVKPARSDFLTLRRFTCTCAYCHIRDLSFSLSARTSSAREVDTADRCAPIGARTRFALLLACSPNKFVVLVVDAAILAAAVSPFDRGGLVHCRDAGVCNVLDVAALACFAISTVCSSPTRCTLSSSLGMLSSP